MTPPSTQTEAKKLAAQSLWNRLDDIVLQWIYGTIYNDLLNTITNPADKDVNASLESIS